MNSSKCEICGKEVILNNKYFLKKTCSEICRYKLVGNKNRIRMLQTGHKPPPEALLRAKQVISSKEWRQKRREMFKTHPAYKVLHKKGLEANLKDPKFCKGLQHRSCKLHRLRSPSGAIYQFKNLRVFIVNNPILFDPSEVAWETRHVKRRGRNVKIEWCKAMSLGGLRPSKGNNFVKGSWHGWTWYSELEDKLNYGIDLIERDL